MAAGESGFVKAGLSGSKKKREEPQKKKKRHRREKLILGLFLFIGAHLWLTVSLGFCIDPRPSSSSSALIRGQSFSPAVLPRVMLGSGFVPGENFIDALHRGLVEFHFGGGEGFVELFHRARADDRG